jgi:hypothetical protein
LFTIFGEIQLIWLLGLSRQVKEIKLIFLIPLIIQFGIFFECEDRGEIELKNKNPMNAFWLNRLKPEYSGDENGFMGNKKIFSILGFGGG